LIRDHLQVIAFRYPASQQNVQEISRLLEIGPVSLGRRVPVWSRVRVQDT